MGLYNNIVKHLEKSDIAFHVGKIAQSILLESRRLATKLKTARVIKSYLKNNKPVKLQLGSGLNILPGWLNSDCSLQFPAECFIDVTKRFPLADETVDYIFCEHLIEHLSYQDGLFMLNECYRVLKNKGRIRISCPDLDKHIQLYRSARNTDSVIAINGVFHNWGHKFIYDHFALKESLEDTGFKFVAPYDYNYSTDANLCDIEAKLDNSIKKYESIVLEATKCPR